MLGKLAKEEKATAFDNQIEKLLSEMDGQDVTSKEYRENLAVVERLYKLKNRGQRTRERVSPDTIVTSLAYLLGIVVVVSYEHSHPLVSKAMNQLPRMKSN